ncbi:hypothetical protein [Aestuariivivens sp. NBU2969]|uniref:hypothetical protein n=1 Tax=Aestuariivivens sp. NBU2969 TaxID=2873267 RepID=UPI001CBAEFFE|nr:hypothetical protein [Aestuariivivens sp. NBU2969]
MELKDIYGVWRHSHGNVITDFAIRTFNNDTGRGLSRFGIHGTDDAGNQIDYAWEGAIKGIVDNQDGTFNITVEGIRFSVDKPQYQELKVWMLMDEVMTLELGNGDRVDFERIR